MIKIYYKKQQTIIQSYGVRVRVSVRHISFYSEFAASNARGKILQTLLRQKKYEEEMSDEQPLTFYSIKK